MKFLMIILPMIFFSSCRDSHPTREPNRSDSNSALQPVEPKDILPLQVSIQGIGRLEPVAVYIKTDPNNVQVEILNESISVHSTNFPLDNERLRSALSKLQFSDFHQNQNAASPQVNDGLSYTLKTQIGTRIIHLESTSPDTLVPQFAANLSPLMKLIDDWNAKASQEYNEILIAKITKEQKIVEPILDFIEKGMTKETVLAKFPNPDRTTTDSISFQNWESSLLKNAHRKGTIGITIYFKNGIVTEWSVRSAG